MKTQSAVSVMCHTRMMFDVTVEKSGFNVHVTGGYMRIADGKERICSFCVIGFISIMTCYVVYMHF